MKTFERRMVLLASPEPHSYYDDGFHIFWVDEASDRDPEEHPEYIVLGTTVVSLEVDLDDLSLQAVEALQAKQTIKRARHASDMQLIDDQIASLMALPAPQPTYQEFDDGVPF